MNIVRSLMNPMVRLRWSVLAVVAAGVLLPLQAMSQVPPRFYWKTLSGANAVPLIVTSMTGNTNPFDAAHTITPGADFEGTLALAGYARTFTLFDRSAMAAVLLPMGRISGDVITPLGEPVREGTALVIDPLRASRTRTPSMVWNTPHAVPVRRSSNAETPSKSVPSICARRSMLAL